MAAQACLVQAHWARRVKIPGSAKRGSWPQASEPENCMAKQDRAIAVPVCCMAAQGYSVQAHWARRVKTPPHKGRSVKRGSWQQASAMENCTAKRDRAIAVPACCMAAQACLVRTRWARRVKTPPHKGRSVKRGSWPQASGPENGTAKRVYLVRVSVVPAREAVGWPRVPAGPAPVRAVCFGFPSSNEQEYRLPFLNIFFYREMHQ